jgi:hypothetical protein
MFKVSVPLNKVEECQAWCDFFDLFCVQVKDEDILDKYASLLEYNENELQEKFTNFAIDLVKITPAHDPNDFEVGLRHNLPVINVLTDSKRL